MLSRHLASLRNQRHRILPIHCSVRAYTNPWYNPNEDPGKYVDGATPDRMNDPEFAAWMKANVPKIYDPEYIEGPLADWAGLDPRLQQLVLEQEEEKEIKEQKLAEKKKARQVEHPLNIYPLATYLRDEKEETNSRRSRFLRNHENMIPGIVLGGDPFLGISSRDPSHKIMIKTPYPSIQRELDRHHLDFEDTRVYDLTIFKDKEDTEGQTVRVVPRDVNWLPVKETVYCVNFCRYHAWRPLKIPMKFVNQEESAALKRDSFIMTLFKKVEVVVEDGAPIPKYLEVDCTGLKAGDIIRRDKILLPEGVQFSRSVMKRRFIDYVCAKVIGSRRGQAEDETESDAEGGTTTPTAA